MPDADLLALSRRLATFMATRDAAHLDGLFADDGVAIIENFAPHVFVGPDAVARWAAGFRAHARDLDELAFTFGAAEDVRLPADADAPDGRAFFALPTTWRGRAAGRPFVEHGVWALAFSRRDRVWRVQGYGWGVASFDWTG